MATKSFTLRLDAELKKELEAEAKLEDRSASYLATQAIKAMLHAKQQKKVAIAQAVKSANKGQFVSQSAVHEWMDSWDTDNELPEPRVDISMKK